MDVCKRKCQHWALLVYADGLSDGCVTPVK